MQSIILYILKNAQKNNLPGTINFLLKTNLKWFFLNYSTLLYQAIISTQELNF